MRACHRYLTVGRPYRHRRPLQVQKRFIFGVQEKPDNRNTFKADPRLMAFYELEQEEIEAGRDAYSSALAAINFCMANNEWAGYTNEIVKITRPAWARSKDMPMTL